MNQEFGSIVRKTRRILEGIRASGIDALPRGVESKRLRLEPVRQKALICRACRLSKLRNSVVFGEGSLDAKLVFVGEGPGREEDREGRPFVGAAGALLTKVIQAMGLRREGVYIANVVKCRPPMNRPPLADEIEACSGYLRLQLEVIRPKVICALGKTAAVALLGLELPMRQFRGQMFHWKEIPVVVTFHPAYLLRNPSAKSEVWKDMKQVLCLLNQ